MRRLFLLTGLGLGLIWTQSVLAGQEAFWSTWSDGQAEVSSYALTQPRYGQLRKGEATLIFVAEPHLRTTRVKPDGVGHPAENVYYVLKLNHLRKFQTGVYPYSVMTSTFSYVDAKAGRMAGAPSKVTFSSQEWCGHVFAQLRFEASSVHFTSNSYFDGEAEQAAQYPYSSRSIVGDNLFVALRSLFGTWIEPGQEQTFTYLPSLTEVRLQHRPLAWSTVTVKRAPKPKQVKLATGAYLVDSYTMTSQGRPSMTVQVESAWPHRIVAWQTSDGERAELTCSRRIKYWEHNKLGEEALLAAHCL